MTTPPRTGGRPNAAFYPVGLRLEGLRVVVAGGGRVGARKVRRLVDYGADVLVVSPEAVEPIGELARAGRIRWERRRAEPRDLEGAVLVFAATDDPAANAALAAESRARGIPVNRADDPLDCGFIVPAVVECGGGRVGGVDMVDAVDGVDGMDGMAGADGADRLGGMAGADRAGGAGGDAAAVRRSDAEDGVGVVSVAVFTGGVAPLLAKWAAGRIRAELGAEFRAVGALLAQVRREVLALAVTQPRRAQIMEAVMASGAPEMAASGDAAGALARARAGVDGMAGGEAAGAGGQSANVGWRHQAQA
jgi:siroheme synthase (precorrin-2 oxidase/ferrochelatase)